MKTAIVYIADGEYGQKGKIAEVYDGAPNQGRYGSDLGRESTTKHLEVPEGFLVGALKAEFDEETNEVSLVEDPTLKSQIQLAEAKSYVKSVVADAKAFGAELEEEFITENVMMGITADGMTGQVLDSMERVMAASRSGSLKEAIARAKEITPVQKDPKYITDARIITFINKIETKLGLPLTTELE